MSVFSNAPTVASHNPNAGDYYQLPVDVLSLYPNKGQAPNKAIGGAPFYGGFAMSSDDVAGAPASTDDLGLTEYSLVNRDGNDFTIFATRNIYFATRALRKGWFAKRDGRSYSKTHVLGIVGVEKDGAIHPVCHAVIRASGYAGKFLEDAINEFARETAQARADAAKDAGISAPISTALLWNVLGSGFGDARNTTTVGKGQNTSAITFTVSEPVADGDLGARYIGDEGVRLLQQISDEQVAMWVADFSKEKIAERATAATSAIDDDEIPGF